MSEIIFESRTQISENGNVILYEKRYHGVLTENGSVRLKAYCAKRIPLGTVTEAKASAQTARNWKGRGMSRASRKARSKAFLAFLLSLRMEEPLCQ